MNDVTYLSPSGTLSAIKESIVKTLVYFDLFTYPLSRAEIFLFMDDKYPYLDFDQALASLLNDGRIHHFDKFYTLRDDHHLVLRRIQGNLKAGELLKVANKISRMLIRFPYVRGVAISGSLSKNFADKDSDIDLFIITAKNRLWIARTLMHLFKKLTYLFNREDYFCMNYYIDELQLEIPEKSIYTAIEIATLIPVEGERAFEAFYAKNVWTRLFLPNKNMRIASARPLKLSLFKRAVEWSLNNVFGEVIDNYLFSVTTQRWNKKTLSKRLNNHGVVMSLKTGKHYAKPDPDNYQRKLLFRFQDKLTQLVERKKANSAF